MMSLQGFIIYLLKDISKNSKASVGQMKHSEKAEFSGILYPQTPQHRYFLGVPCFLAPYLWVWKHFVNWKQNKCFYNQVTQRKGTDGVLSFELDEEIYFLQVSESWKEPLLAKDNGSKVRD